jgi:aspartate/methionine/tyrosine aminotransferase
MKAANNFQSHATSNVSNVAQRAALAAVAGGLDDVAMMRDAYTRRGTLLHKLLTEIPGVTCIEPQGAFYCFPNVSGLLGRTYHGATPSTSLELADIVLEQAKVAFVPGEAFGAPGYARFSFAMAEGVTLFLFLAIMSAVLITFLGRRERAIHG